MRCDARCKRIDIPNIGTRCITSHQSLTPSPACAHQTVPSHTTTLYVYLSWYTEHYYESTKKAEIIATSMPTVRPKSDGTAYLLYKSSHAKTHRTIPTNRACLQHQTHTRTPIKLPATWSTTVSCFPLQPITRPYTSKAAK